MLIRAFGILEGTVAQLAPDLSMMKVAKEFGLQYVKQHFNLKDQLTNDLWSSYQAVHQLLQLPGKTNELIDSVNDGSAAINFKYRNEDRLVRLLTRISNRLVVALILAAIIVGSSLLVQGSNGHPHIYRLGVTGYSLAIVIVIILVISELVSAFRHRRQQKKRF